MNYLNAFKIPFKGLKIGTHEYEWEIDGTFFEVFENPDIKTCHLNVNLEMDRQERMFTLDFNIRGEVTVECDRCLADLVLPVYMEQQYIIKIGHELKEESEDVLVIPESEYQIDVASLIHDYVILSLPIQKIHEDDEHGKSGCDQKVLKVLKKLSKKDSTDPRWDALKKIKFDNNN